MYDGFLDASLEGPGPDWDAAVDYIIGMHDATVAEFLHKDDALVPPEPACDPVVLHDVLLSTQRDLLHIQHHSGSAPSEFKQAGYLAFWIRKLKPFCSCDLFAGTHTNELLGLHFGLAEVAATHPGVYEKVVGTALWHEWLYDLRYRTASGHELAKQFHLLSLPTAS